MKALATLLTALAIVLLQSTLLVGWRIGEAQVHLALLLVIAWTVGAGVEAGLVRALLVGVLTGFVSAAPFGAEAVALMCAVAVAAGLRRSVLGRSNLLPLLAGGAATIGYQVGLALVFTLAGVNVGWLHLLVAKILPSTLLHAALSVPCIWIVGQMTRRRQLYPSFGT